MPAIKFEDIAVISNKLNKRAWSDDDWTSSGGARWAFFAIFVVLIILVILGTIRVNRKRSRQGIQPIYGTRWMTPPNYRQSQNQYDQPDNVRDPDLPSAYVPTYTEEANEYDMGYYDRNGKFHANPNAKAANMAPPQAAHRRESTAHGDGIPISSTIPGMLTNEDAHDVEAPAGPPPGMEQPHHDSQEDLGDLYRPSAREAPTRTSTSFFTSSLPGAFNSTTSSNGATGASAQHPRHAEIQANEFTEGSSSSSNLESLPSFSEGPNPPKISGKN
ncbi:chitin synthesis regulation, resistance to congo red-domain-containing protein [Scheffersomyces xylosifermentans]|uniref:chitin synthesis regulation, resistance to congo red-domain-containing protein n=1 Tax=Scheffersomyces xylosifermentans TaxID=1304137 RepID=UPI00315DF70D